MRKEQGPPTNARFLDAQGNINPMWIRWFDKIAMKYDDYRKTKDITTTTDLTLTTDDFGKSIVFNNGVNNVNCYLMTVTSRDIHCWVGPIYRLGTGAVTIVASTGVRIEYSSYGGSIMCNEVRRAAANVTLELVTATQWGIIGATGLWYVG